MRRNRGAIRYATGTATSSIGIWNMYIYGGALISLFTLVIGLLDTGSLAGAVNIVIDFYIARLVPWPIDELLLAETVRELIISHLITIGVGLAVATSKWWMNA